MNSIDKCFDSVRKILANLPQSWVELTTHRLDIYNDALAKSEFLQQLDKLHSTQNFTEQSLASLPTAYDYIRLGHQLSSILEWVIAQINQLPTLEVITFTSKTMPILAVVRHNTLQGKPSYIYYNTDQAPLIDLKRLTSIYGYQFQLIQLAEGQTVPAHQDGSVIFVTQSDYKTPLAVNENVDVSVNIHGKYGSTVLIHNRPVKNTDTADLVKAVQHVRRRETIAMTPINCLNLLQEIVNGETVSPEQCQEQAVNRVHDCIMANTGSSVTPLVASSGLSIQYAILMGLVEDSLLQYPSKPIQIIIPPNCYGGTNDQARRVAELIEHVSIVDFPVDGGKNMVTSLDQLLAAAAKCDAVPLVLAEIPTNPRVEVPDMHALAKVLATTRFKPDQGAAIAPVFIVDQTFCPNVKLLGQDSELASVKVVSFSSGSKFPSGGRCIAGYCAVNNAAQSQQVLIAEHLHLSDNGATAQQLNILAENMPSMPARITKAYENTRQMVAHIRGILPQMKINFVPDDLALLSFTPSVFSMDLPAVGDSDAAREAYKRELNQKLIDYMLANHPDDCKYCVSYGQLKGTYWTIPATSTQGTTKETDKDYIVRVALSPKSDVAALTASFSEFCRRHGLI